MSDSARDEIDAIKQLRYKYLRTLDTKEWDAMAECFSEDAVSSYDSGAYSFTGRDAIMDFLRKALGAPHLITLHHCHHPEIELTSDTTAKGTWYLEDKVIDTKSGMHLQGAAFYSEEYVKIDGAWKIKSTGYRRTYEEVWNRGDVPSLKITKSMFEG
jgi:bile-acid 7alpha-dehydratase